MKPKESLELLELGDLEDFNIESKSYKKRKLETRTVSIFVESNIYKDIINRPFIFILLPFFSPQRQRNLNLIYEIENAGIKFSSSLSNDALENFSNRQPGEFEKNVLDFIMWKIQQEIEHKNFSNKNENVTFYITELIEYLGLKFHSSYYKKVEEALYNLQETTYKIKIKNQKKAGNIIREVYEKPLNLIRYRKVKEKNTKTLREQIFYEVELDYRLIQELEIKHYSIFDKELLTELRNKNKVAERIFQFISMKRFTNNIGEFRVETLASIIPFSLYSIIKKKDKDGNIKEYRVSKKKTVLKKLEKAFQDLIDLEYLKMYEVIELKSEKSYKIKYEFNPKKNNKLHKSTYLNSSDENEIKIPEIFDDQEREVLKKYLEKSEKTEQDRKDVFNRVIQKDKYYEIYKNLNSEIKEKIYLNAIEKINKIENRDEFFNLVEEKIYIAESIKEVMKI